MAERFSAEQLRAFTTALFAAAGSLAERADVVAETLLEADLMGHDTHGLALAPGYLEAIAEGTMAMDGAPEVVADRGATVTWDGRYLCGVWLVHQAMHLAVERVAQHGVVTVVIRRSHHIACLAAYLAAATERGLMMVLASSDPSVGAVAPHGSHSPTYTPNPIAVGIPTRADPVLIDISASTTTMGLVGRRQGDGGRLPGKWLIDNAGNLSDDPDVTRTDPPGAIMPLGGAELGHKGFALGILVEALTSGLGGYGRADAPPQWGAGVFLQIIDPAAFGGADDYAHQTSWLAETCRSAPVADGRAAVRMPGDGALARRRAALRDGVMLYPGIMDGLRRHAARLGVTPPDAVA